MKKKTKSAKGGLRQRFYRQDRRSSIGFEVLVTDSGSKREVRSEAVCSFLLVWFSRDDLQHRWGGGYDPVVWCSEGGCSGTFLVGSYFWSYNTPHGREGQQIEYQSRGICLAVLVARKLISPVGGVNSRLKKKEERENESLSVCNWWGK